jgi:hypothetical protein
MNTPLRWVATLLLPEQIRARSITVKDKAGREMKGQLDVAMVNDRGQSVVRARYNLNPASSRAAFAAFYVTQEQMDAYNDAEGTCILNAPSNPSRCT